MAVASAGPVGTWAPVGDAAPTEGFDDARTPAVPTDVVRLTVPAEADYVAVVRLTVQAIAARSGCTDDARSRLRAAVGAAFFELVHEVGTGGAVRVELQVDPTRLVVDLAGRAPSGDGARRTVHVEVEHPPVAP